MNVQDGSLSDESAPVTPAVEEGAEKTIMPAPEVRIFVKCAAKHSPESARFIVTRLKAADGHVQSDRDSPLFALVVRPSLRALTRCAGTKRRAGSRVGVVGFVAVTAVAG